MKSILSKLLSFILFLILEIISLCIGILFILSGLSPYIEPSTSSLITSLGFLFPIIFILHLMLFLCWTFWRKWKIVIVYILSFIICISSISYFLPINLPNEGLNEKTPRLKVLSYNTYVFGYQGHSKKNPNPILKYVRESNADLVCLQEASYTIRVGSCINRKILHDYLQDTYPYISEQVAQNDGSMIILLSKYPIKKAIRLPIKSLANGAVAFSLDVNGKDLLLIGVHLESFKLNPKLIKGIMNKIKEGKLSIIKTLFQKKIIPTLIKHEEQAKIIHQFIEDSPTKNIIVCGDFNDTAISFAHHKINEGLDDSFKKSACGFGFSIRKSIFVARIDHILYKGELKATNSFIDDQIQSSDHYPIISNFKWIE